MSFSPQNSNDFSPPAPFQGYGDSVHVLDVLCPELVKILECEVENGNVVLRMEHGMATKFDCLIIMQYPLSFGRHQELDIPPDSLERTVETNYWYPLGEGLRSKKYPHEIRGPFPSRKMTWVEWMDVRGGWFLLMMFGLIVGILLIICFIAT